MRWLVRLLFAAAVLCLVRWVDSVLGARGWIFVAACIEVGCVLIALWIDDKGE